MNHIKSKIQDLVLKILETKATAPTVDLVFEITPHIKKIAKHFDETEIREFIHLEIRKMRQRKLIYSHGMRPYDRTSTPEARKVGQCLVVGLKPKHEAPPSCHETLEAMQRAARDYLDNRQFDKMGL